MIQIQCPACQKVQPESDLMIDAALKQRCNYCGVVFEVNITKNAFLGTEKISGKIVSKGLLDSESDQELAFKIEPTIRTVFAVFLFLLGASVVFFTHGEPFTKMLLIILAVICLATGAVAGMLAGRVGYSEVLTPGGAGVIAGLALAAIFSLQSRGEMQSVIQHAFPMFGVFAVGSFAGGIVAWVLRKFFGIRMQDAEK